MTPDIVQLLLSSMVFDDTSGNNCWSGGPTAKQACSFTIVSAFGWPELKEVFSVVEIGANNVPSV